MTRAGNVELRLFPTQLNAQLVEAFRDTVLQGVLRDSGVAVNLDGNVHPRSGVVLLQDPEQILLEVAGFGRAEVSNVEAYPGMVSDASNNMTGTTVYADEGLAIS